MSTFDRFLEKFVKRPTGCWEWVGGLSHGYAQFYFKNLNGTRGYRGHRYAYEHYKGQIPRGLSIDHLCRNRKCVNPDHLEAVTNKDNVLRGAGRTALNFRKTVCKMGHKLQGQNLILVKRKSGSQRACRQCSKVIKAKWRKTKGKSWREKNIKRIREQNRLNMRRYRAIQALSPSTERGREDK